MQLAVYKDQDLNPAKRDVKPALPVPRPGRDREARHVQIDCYYSDLFGLDVKGYDTLYIRSGPGFLQKYMIPAT